MNKKKKNKETWLLANLPTDQLRLLSKEKSQTFQP